MKIGGVRKFSCSILYFLLTNCIWGSSFRMTGFYSVYILKQHLIRKSITKFPLRNDKKWSFSANFLWTAKIKFVTWFKHIRLWRKQLRMNCRSWCQYSVDFRLVHYVKKANGSIWNMVNHLKVSEIIKKYYFFHFWIVFEWFCYLSFPTSYTN